MKMIPTVEVAFEAYRAPFQGEAELPLGCRATHKPTGTSVQCHDYPKCYDCNKKAAYARLRKALFGEAAAQPVGEG